MNVLTSRQGGDSSSPVLLLVFPGGSEAERIGMASPGIDVSMALPSSGEGLMPLEGKAGPGAQEPGDCHSLHRLSASGFATWREWVQTPVRP